MVPEALAAHRALVSLWSQLYAGIEGARFEPRSDLIVALCPGFAWPSFNGPWVVEDSPAAVAALPAAITEVEAAGEQPWVQSRSGHTRTQAAARELGLTQVERLPVLVARPEDLTRTEIELEIGVITGEEIDETLDVLVAAFAEPRDVFARFTAQAQKVSGARWYVGRHEGTIVSTALGVTTERATGVFNVATSPERRRCGYGAALTARAARDGFTDGAELAYLHSSPAGHTLYRRLGFRDVDEYVLLTRPRPT